MAYPSEDMLKRGIAEMPALPLKPEARLYGNHVFTPFLLSHDPCLMAIQANYRQVPHVRNPGAGGVRQRVVGWC